MKDHKKPNKFYKTSAWAGVNGLRNQALRRDNYECQMCKAEGKVHLDSVKVKGEKKTIELNVHHIKEIEEFPELALTLSNLITICLRHHNEIHERYQTTEKKWDDERW